MLEGISSKSVYSGQTTEDGTAVNQDLRVRSLHTVHSHLGKSTVLAVVFQSQPGRKIQSFSQGLGLGGVEDLLAYGIYNYRGFGTLLLASIGRYHYLFQVQYVLFQFEFYFDGSVLPEGDHSFLAFVSYIGDHDNLLSLRKVDQLEVSRFIGGGADGGSFQGYVGKGDVLTPANHMSHDIGIAIELLAHAELEKRKKEKAGKNM